MYTLIVLALLTLAPIAQAGSAAHCTTRYDEALRRWRTECSDSSRAITRWDAGLQRYRTDVTKAPKGDKAPRGWPGPGQAPRH